MDAEAKKILFNQIRVAHRLLASYYQRIKQLLYDVTNDERLGLEFLMWGPTNFDPPCRRSTNILNRWSWDLLPGCNTEYLFFHGTKEKPQQPGDWLLAIDVISDTTVFTEDMEDELDALELSVSAEDSHSVLRCYLATPHKELHVDWQHEIWDVIDWPKQTKKPKQQCMDKDRQIYASAFEIPLEELATPDSAEILVQKIIEYRDVILKK